LECDILNTVEKESLDATAANKQNLLEDHTAQQQRCPASIFENFR
jgi:hypothetical protein